MTWKAMLSLNLVGIALWCLTLTICQFIVHANLARRPTRAELYSAIRTHAPYVEEREILRSAIEALDKRMSRIEARQRK